MNSLKNLQREPVEEFPEETPGGILRGDLKRNLQKELLGNPLKKILKESPEGTPREIFRRKFRRILQEELLYEL